MISTVTSSPTSAPLRALGAVAAVCAAAALLAGCSSNSDSSPETVTVTAPATATGTATSPTGSTEAAPTDTTNPGDPNDPVASECGANAESTPVPSFEPFGPVPDYAEVSVTLSGLLSGTITPGGAPAEVDVTLCNDTPVDYPEVGVVLVLTNCTCTTHPMGLPEGSIDRYDEATGSWVALPHPVVGGGMDYLGTFTDVQPLPKGKQVTVKYRVSLDASMTDGDGGLEAAAVVPNPVVKIGGDEMQFAVVP